MDLKKAFERLMTTPCLVYAPTYTKRPDGTSERGLGAPVSTRCNFHSSNQARVEFAGKMGEQVASVVCLPLEVEVAADFCIEIEGIKYKVVGVREASRKFETIVEVVAYE